MFLVLSFIFNFFLGYFIGTLYIYHHKRERERKERGYFQSVSVEIDLRNLRHDLLCPTEDSIASNGEVLLNKYATIIR